MRKKRSGRSKNSPRPGPDRENPEINPIDPPKPFVEPKPEITPDPGKDKPEKIPKPDIEPFIEPKIKPGKE